MRILVILLFITQLFQPLEANSVDKCECFRPWNCCWLCGYAQEWYLKEELLDTPIDQSNPPLRGDDTATCFDTCSAAKALIVFKAFIYRTIVEEKCFLSEADYKKGGLRYIGNSYYDAVKSFSKTATGAPLAYYQDYLDRMDLFTKLAVGSNQRTILVNLMDQRREEEHLEQNRKTLTPEEIKQKEDLIRYKKSIVAKFKQSEENILKLSYVAKNRIHELFGKLHQSCDLIHDNVFTKYAIGLQYLLKGQPHEYIYNAHHLFETLSKEEIASIEPLLSLKLGEAYLDAASYEKAVQCLDVLLKRGASQEGSLLRAAAQFQVGQFEKALSDFNQSGFAGEIIEQTSYWYKDYHQFYSGMHEGLFAGFNESTKEFRPALFRDPYALSHGLFFCEKQVRVSKQLRDAIENYITALGSIGKEAVQMVPELQDCMNTWKALSSEAKGEKIGYFIGKYGLDAFGVENNYKLHALYKEIRKAFWIQTFELMKQSLEEKNALILAATRFESTREGLLARGYQLERGLQAKYMSWYPTLLQRKILNLPSVKVVHPNIQATVAYYQGHGLACYGTLPGLETYGECAEFGEKIGLWMPSHEEIRFATNRGVIHFTKEGNVFVVPLRPASIPPSCATYIAD